MPKEIMKIIDAKRKKFLWAGNESLTGRKCKVNWTRTARHKKGGGIGVLHMAKFSRPLRLRWLWQQWMNEGTPWDDCDVPCTQANRMLFAAATTLTIGDGNKILF